jgi:hypothetical protein
MLAVALRPFAVASRLFAIGSRTFPPPLAAAKSLLAGRVARIEQLPALEPLHDGGRVLLAQPIQRRQQLLRVVRAKSRRLVVNENRPVRVARRHDPS